MKMSIGSKLDQVRGGGGVPNLEIKRMMMMLTMLLRMIVVMMVMMVMVVMDHH